ncbi:MAG: 4-diphosphocytidyl-2C-methyl-D-erythritol kinase, partial [Planctomycetota bacterium]
MARRTVTVTAGAKVNPRLVIHGRRADGFHELTTLML